MSKTFRYKPDLEDFQEITVYRLGKLDIEDKRTKKLRKKLKNKQPVTSINLGDSNETQFGTTLCQGFKLTGN